MLYTISYDLNKPGQNYPKLFKAIKCTGNWCHPVDSTWFVNSQYSAEAIRDLLVSTLDSRDSIIVVHTSAPGAWSGLSEELNRWLKANL